MMGTAVGFMVESGASRRARVREVHGPPRLLHRPGSVIPRLYAGPMHVFPLFHGPYYNGFQNDVQKTSGGAA